MIKEMTNILTRLFLYLVVIILVGGFGSQVLLGVGGCTGLRPAAPPAPPAEVPTFLTLPDPRIDVSDLASSPSSDLSVALVGPGGEFSDEIAIAPNKIGDANLSFGLGLRDISIPVSDATTFVSESGDIKVDFSDFDFDGVDGQEGCSGRTSELPICMRIWVNGERYFQGVFDSFPSVENPGVGRFRVVPTSTGGDAGVTFVFNYDHSDSLNKSTEFLMFTPASSFAKSLRRAQISQVGEEGSAKKTINYSDRFFFDPLNPDTVRYIGSFLQNSNPDKVFWSGSLEISPGLASPNFGGISNVCAQVSTGDAVLQGTCQDGGIDTTGIDFIDFATDEDFAFSDFPLTPTF